MDSIPEYEEYRDISVTSQLEALYEKTKIDYQNKYKGDFLVEMLEKLQCEISSYGKIYHSIYNELTQSFLNSLRQGKSYVTIKIDETKYKNVNCKEKFYFNKAFQIFCHELTIKKYPWYIYDEIINNVGIFDEEDTLEYKVISIILKNEYYNRKSAL
jgi:hypothetical protein